LQDAALSAQLLYPASDEWTGWRRGWMDVYDEGALLWLEADGIIRDLTQGQHSLDDFCREFFDGKGGAPTVKTYTMDDVVEALDKLAHYDWENFFSERLKGHGPDAPVRGITRAGWKLVYSETPNGYVSLREGLEHKIDASWSIGASVLDDGLVQDVIPGMPGFQAGMAPGMKISRVNGEKWSLASLKRAIARAANPGSAIDLILQQGGGEIRSRIAYHDGEKYPHLRRLEGKNDLLEKIIAPRGR
jgi:predicted metalloprotease with PDZ domain